MAAADRQVRPAEADHLGRRPAEDALGKIMRRLLRDIAEGRELGDVTTLRDPAVMEQLENEGQGAPGRGELEQQPREPAAAPGGLASASAAQAPGRSREVPVRDRGEALLVLPQRQQQMRDLVPGRQVTGLTDTHAEAVDPVSSRPHQDRALAADQPRSEPPRSSASPVSPSRSRAVVPYKVAEQPERRPLRRGICRRPPIGFTPRAPRRACRWSTASPCPRKIAETGKASGWIQTSSAAGSPKVTTTPTLHSVQIRPSLLETPLAGPPPPRHRGRFGENAHGGACLQAQPPGDRAAHHDQVGVERQLAHDLGRAVGQRGAGQHALVELAPEGLDRRALRRPRPRRSSSPAPCAPCDPA